MVLFTDIVGFTSQAQSSESQLSQLLEREREILLQAASKYGAKGPRSSSGREPELGLKKWLRGAAQKERQGKQGSYSVLIFDDPLNAVKCALEFQQAIQKHNRTVPRDMELRMGVGIHQGDFEIRGEEVAGEALGVASRIWNLAGPGGVCVTGEVERRVRMGLKERFVRLDPHPDDVAGQNELFKLELGTRATEVIAEELDRKRVAVLPFVSISSDPQDEFFADGLTEELIDRLAQARELEVIARTSVMVFKKKEKRVADIGRELRAGALVEGSVRRAGNRIRVTAQLVDANTEGHLWSSRYDKDLEDIFEVQSNIATQVAEALRIRLLPDEKRAIEKEATSNMRAHELYLRGHHHWNERTEEGVAKGIEFLKKAVEEDPEFAAAYSDLASCYVMASDYAMMEGEEARALVSKYAGVALEKDPELSQPHAALAIVFERDFDWANADREFKLAIGLNPNNATAHHWYALSSWFRHKTELSLREWRRARELDPLSPIVNSALGTCLALSGSKEEGLEMLKQVLAMNEKFPVAHRNLCFIYAREGMLDEASLEARRLESLAPGVGYQGYAAWTFAMAGQRKEAERILGQLLKAQNTHYVDPAIIAMIYAGLGDDTQALQWLDSAVTKKSSAVPHVNFVPAFDALRNDPRFRGIMQRAGLG